jgi:hypothetical protein
MKIQLKQALAGMKGRVLALNGITAHPGNLASLDQAFDAALNQGEAAKAKIAALMERARNKEIEAVTELNALRSTTIDLYVRAMSNFTAFFKTVPLQPNEQVAFIHTFRNPVSVRYIGQDGSPRTAKAVKAQKQLFIDMRELHSDEVEYAVRDINLGTDVAAAAQATVDIGWDMANKVDLEAFTLLTAGRSTVGQGIYGPFNLTGAPLSRTWIPNARILPPNLPDTNDLALADNSATGATSRFRMDVIRAIMHYCNRWANVWGAPIRPTGLVLVPSLDATDLALEVTPTSLIFPNQVAEGLLQNYTRFEYMGVTWTLVPDVTLTPGTCFPVLDKPVGEMYLKPAFDEEFVETNRKKNLETRSQMKVINFAVPEPWRVNALRVTYRSAN